MVSTTSWQGREAAQRGEISYGVHHEMTRNHPWRAKYEAAYGKFIVDAMRGGTRHPLDRLPRRPAQLAEARSCSLAERL